MKIRYYLFLMLCYATHPFRWLMPNWQYKHVAFALRLLFSKTAAIVVQAQTMLETRISITPYKSNLYLKNNNLFGMGKSDKGEYQQSSTNNGVIGEPKKSAKYFSIYQSIFDYYDYLKNRSSGKAYNVLKSIEDTTITYQNNEAEMANICDQFTIALKTQGYYTASQISYFNTLLSYTKVSTVSNWKFLLNLVYAIFLPSFIVIMYRRYR